MQPNGCILGWRRVDLRVMEGAGLVGSTQNGRESVWELEDRRLVDARRHLQAISPQWDETLDRLKRFVER